MSAPIRSFMTQLQRFKESQPWIYIPTTTSSFKILDAVDKFSEALYEQLVATSETLEIPVLESEGEEDWSVRPVELSIHPETNQLILDEDETIAFTELRHVCERSCPFRNRELHFVDVLYIHQGKPKHLYIDIADGLLCLRLINIIRKIIFNNATSFEPVLRYMSPRFMEVTVDVDLKQPVPTNGVTSGFTLQQFVAALSDQGPPKPARLDKDNGDVSRIDYRQTGESLLARCSDSVADVLPVENPEEEEEKFTSFMQMARRAGANAEGRKESQELESAEEADGKNREASAKDEDGEKVEEASEDKVDGAIVEKIGDNVAEGEQPKTEMKSDDNSDDVSGDKTQQEACVGDIEKSQERTEVTADKKAEETKEEKTGENDEEKKEGENEDTTGETGERKPEEKPETASEEGKAVTSGAAGDEVTVQDLEADVPMQVKPSVSKDPEMANSTQEEKPETGKAPNADIIDHGKETIDVYTDYEDGNFPEDKEQQQIPPAQSQAKDTGGIKKEESETAETTTEGERPEKTNAEEVEKTAAGSEDRLELKLMELTPGYICFYRGILQRTPLQVALLLKEAGDDVVEFVKYNAGKGKIYIETPSHGFNITGEEDKMKEIAAFLRENKPMPTEQFNDLQALASHLYQEGHHEVLPPEVARRDVLQSAAVSAAPSRGRGPSRNNDEGRVDVEEERKQMMIDENLAIARSKMDFLEAYHNSIRDAANPQEDNLIEFLNMNWTPMETQIQENVRADLIPGCDSKSLALDPDDIDHFTKAMNDVQEYLMNMDPILAASRLRSYREVFMESSMREMKAIFEAFDEVILLKGLYVMALMQNLS